MIDVDAFGFEPRGHHAVNLALHALNAVALFLVLRSLTGDTLPSLLVAAVFAVHPANVESVAWISQRKTLLSTFFALLSIAAYARHVRGGGRRPYAASVGFLALSLMSKPMFVTLPFALLLLDYWPLARTEFEPASGGRVAVATLIRGWWRLLPAKLPHLVLCAVVAAITLDAQRDAMSTIDHYPIAQRLGNVALSYVEYLATFFAPVRLAVFYPLYPEHQTAALVLACVAGLVALTLALGWLGLRHRYLLIGMAVVPPDAGAGDRTRAGRDAVDGGPLRLRAVLGGSRSPSRGRLHGGLGTRLHARRAALVAAAIAAIPLTWFGVLAHRQAEKWHDPFTLFQSAIENTDGNWLAHGLLAERYYAQSDLPKTIEHSLEAIRYNRNMGTVRSTYGLALHDLGKKEEALEQFELAAEQEPDNPTAT
jgi:tetratricopeptide (TPR) repeat protein